MNNLILKRFKPTNDETELKLIENLLKKELKQPFVKCSYDCVCSHKYKDIDEFDYRQTTAKELEAPELTDFIINYEIYKTKSDEMANNGGYDGEVHELRYLIDNMGYIVIVDM